jgi:hypothetical protein
MIFLPPAIAPSASPADWVTSRLDHFAGPWVTGTKLTTRCNDHWNPPHEYGTTVGHG